MQHHGAPTRLLDFTKSPYVATFFALEGATGDAAVFALSAPILWSLQPELPQAYSREEIDPRKSGNFEKVFLVKSISFELEIIWKGSIA